MLKYAIPLLAFAPLLATGQDTTNIREVIINQNRLQIPFNKDNRNVEILTAEQIRQLPARSLNEVLGLLNGVDLRQRGPFGTQADISIDGGSFDQTLVLLNGAKVSDPQTGHHSLNLPIPLDAIERIEVLRGAAARIYGVNALTGAVNIITKAIENTAIQANVYTGSSFKNRDEEQKPGIYYVAGTQLGASLFKERHQHQLFYSKDKSNGQRYNTASDNQKVFYQGKAKIDAVNQVEWLGSYIYNDFGANAYYAAPGDRDAHETVETVFASVSSKHQLSDRFYLSPRISNRYNEDFYAYTPSAVSKHYNNSFSAELNSRYSTLVGDFGFGLESRMERINSNNMGNHDRNNHGAYAEFRTENLKNIILNVGAYVNYNTQYGWQVYPGFDFGYKLDAHWKVVLNAGSSQRIPTFTDLYIKQPTSTGNSALRPEDAWQAEGAVKFANDQIIAHAGYFYRKINNFVDWVRYNPEGGAYQAENLGENTVRGLNTNVDYQIPSSSTLKFRVNVGYNYLDPTFRSQNNAISRYRLENLKHQAKLVVAASHQKWNASVANRFNQRVSDDSYFLSDLRLAYNFPFVSVYADAQNIFDVTYLESGAVPMPGRWYTLGLRYQWTKR
ncbi:TonB-dependent receptor plug domain-containing protein [Sphingobacterium deserti]|uniref:TonB-dependent receptor n=1 Tax=Sphingobacterium deserti TaxID=1229276 RepID=A0A0B8T672_9SPHI|nr:TonB-dependent receptor [Sphingobacterium deserti]KGE13394.1 TonB-dependent receptor [Sphingobacterium deserti]